MLYSPAAADITVCSFRKSYSSTRVPNYSGSRHTLTVWPTQNRRQNDTASNDAVCGNTVIMDMMMVPVVTQADVNYGIFANSRWGRHGLFRLFAVMSDLEMASCIITLGEDTTENASRGISESRSMTRSRASSTTIRDELIVSDFDVSSNEEFMDSLAHHTRRHNVLEAGSSRSRRRLPYLSMQLIGDVLHQEYQSRQISDEFEEGAASDQLQRACQEMYMMAKGATIL